MRNILFMGEVLASVTHEMQNIMAIIKESGALANDILEINARPRLKHGDKLDEALTNVHQQVGRGRDLMLALNAFAHAAADYPAHCDLRRFAKQILTLANRMVRMKECTLDVRLEGPPLPIKSNALLLMQSVYSGVAAVLAGCVKGDTLLVRANAGACPEDGVVMHFEAATSRDIPENATLVPVLELLGAVCQTGPGRLEIVFAPYLEGAGK